MPGAPTDRGVAPTPNDDIEPIPDRVTARPDRRGKGSGEPRERVTVNVTRRASRALDLAAQLTGDTKTDTINRAVQIYAFLERVAAEGGSVYVRARAGSELELLKVF
jgi:hypothetical protein